MIIIPIWLLASFYLARIITGYSYLWINEIFNFNVDTTVLQAVLMMISYTIAILLTIAIPWAVFKDRVTSEDIGLNRLPTWTDILITPAGIVIYLVVSAILINVVARIIPGFDVNQVQDIGFDRVYNSLQRSIAFLSLVVIAPIFEEILFRGYLFSKLKKVAHIIVAILITSAVFGLAHGAWNVAIDVFVLSIVMCVAREITGSLWAPILLHMSKNAIAFYFMFNI